MKTLNLTVAQESWLETQVKPMPEAILLVYAGTTYKEWKFAGFMPSTDLDDMAALEDRAMKQFPSAKLIRILTVTKP